MDQLWFGKYDEADHTPATLPDRTLLDVVRDAAGQRPGLPALLFKGGSYLMASWSKPGQCCELVSSSLLLKFALMPRKASGLQSTQAARVSRKTVKDHDGQGLAPPVGPGRYDHRAGLAHDKPQVGPVCPEKGEAASPALIPSCKWLVSLLQSLAKTSCFRSQKLNRNLSKGASSIGLANFAWSRKW